LCIAIVGITGIFISRNKRKHALAVKQLEFKVKEQEWDKERAVFQSQLEERSRISRELHDDLGANLTSIVLTGELIKKKNPDILPHMNTITESANEMADTLNEIVWSLNNRNDSLHGLAAYIRKLATKLLQQANITLDFITDLPEEDIAIDSRKRRLIYLSTKEIINNCIKHSKATAVKMRFHYTNNELAIDIIDNGIGLPERIDHTGRNGLKNIQRNMEIIGGSYHCAGENGLHSTLNIRIES
jgi:signal transduction histidine kinase